MKRIKKKYWILFGFLFLFIAYQIFKMFLPSIKLINESNSSFNITSAQIAVYISDGKIWAGGTPDKYDILRMQEIKGVIGKGESQKIVFNIFDIPKIYNDEIIAFSVDWQNESNEYFKTISYKVLDNNKGICSVIITIKEDNYFVEEVSNGFCLKSLTGILE